MQAELERILELQADYSPANTPAMQERGRLIRMTAASRLWDQASSLSRAAGLASDDFMVEGRDGTGLKTRVPWVRFGSRLRSPSATTGFYVVYLFDALGDTVALSLNQGTTNFVNGGFAPKPTRVLKERASWARAILGDWVDAHARTRAIALHDSRLGTGYERGNIAAVAYARGDVPDDTALLRDAQTYAEALGRLYAAHAKQPLPYETPELEQAIVATDEAAGKAAGPTGAGFRTSAAEIKLIEQHAVNLARAHYERDGWTVKEQGKPFDLQVRRGRERLTVEVKGTTSDGCSVFLTAGEVAHHAKAYPSNALVVVHHIVLDRTSIPTKAGGGALCEKRGWMIDQDDLQPVSYRYVVPPTLFGR